MIDPVRLAALLEAEQRTSWRRGEEVWVESYLARQPVLKAEPEAVLDLIRTEVMLRQERGANPHLGEYLQRFASLDGPLRKLFSAIDERARIPRTRLVSTRDRVPGECRDLVGLASDGGPPEVPGYEVLIELGRGGMGIVYQARQLSLNRLVALKMILGGAHASESHRTRFRTEAEAIARLAHPNIVQIHEVGEHQGWHYLSLEYVAGGTLDEFIADTPQPEIEAARLLETIARAIHQAHERGILHRDLKPSNVLLTVDGTPKVADFGLAKLLDVEVGPTRTEAVIGTPSYMSPEQALGKTKEIGVPSDVYSLGAILYEMLTGQAPFSGNTMLQTLEQVRSHEAVPPRRLCKGVSRDLETICLKCLEKEPGKRYATASELADDLRRFLNGVPVVARPIAPWRRWSRMARRRPMLLAKSAVVAAALCLLVSAVWYHQVSGQLVVLRVSETEKQFNQLRDDAFFSGLLSIDRGALVTRPRSADGWGFAESSAREALVRAGLPPEVGEPALAASLPPTRRGALSDDCYVLLLVLAHSRSVHPAAKGGDREPYREGLQFLERARRLGIETKAYHNLRADLLEKLGKKDDATKERAIAVSLLPASALDHFLAGQERCREGAWEEAIGCFNLALGAQPSHFWARFLLAVCQLKLQRGESALAGLNACLTQQPEFVWGYLFRGYAHEELNAVDAVDAAEADFAKALRLHPNDSARYFLHLTRGTRRFYQRSLDQAADDFRAARDLDPDNYHAYLNLAQVSLARKKFAEADEQWREALRRRPPAEVVAGYHIERARSLSRNGRYVESVHACDAALEVDPDYFAAHDPRGRALLHLGRWEEAERDFDRYLLKGGEAVKRGEAVLDVYRGRGLARMKRGRYPEAIEDYTARDRAIAGRFDLPAPWLGAFLLRCVEARPSRLLAGDRTRAGGHGRLHRPGTGAGDAGSSS